MSRLAANLALARDVLVLTSRQRVLWVFLLLGTVISAVLIAGTEIEPVDDGWRLVLFGWSPIETDKAAEVAHPAMLLTIFAEILVRFVAGFFGVGLGLLACHDVVGSAFRPGRAGLLLSRPISRAEVVTSRFAGALAFGFIQIGWLCGLTFLLAGLKFGVWLPTFLLVAPALLLKFAVLLSICSLGVVWSRTRSLGLSAAAMAWAFSYGINLARIRVAEESGLGGLFETIAVWGQILGPQISHQNLLARLACKQPPDVPWFEPGVVILQGLLWVVIPLALTVFVVRRRDL